MAGDFLREVPPGGDLYVLSQILHNWDDERARMIVRNWPPGEPYSGGGLPGDRLRASLDGPEPPWPT